MSNHEIILQFMQNLKSDTVLTDKFKDAINSLSTEEINSNCFDVDTSDGLLSKAVSVKNMALVKFLVEEKSANINRSNSSCPLVYAIFDLQIFEYLIGKGANVNCCNDFSFTTPLIYIVQNIPNKDIEKMRIMRLLLENGADIDAKDYSNKTAIDYAKDNPEILAILTRYKYYRSILAKTIIMTLFI